MTTVVSLILAFILTFSGSPVKSFITGYDRGDYIDVNESKEVGDTKPSLGADYIDRRENFDFSDTPDGSVERPNSAPNNPPLYNNVMLDTGEFVYGETDLSIPGRGFDFVFQRTYRSQVTYSGPIGWGWDHNYNRRLQGMSNGDIFYHDGSGRRERFKALKDDNKVITGYEAPRGWFVELHRLEDGSTRLLYPDRSYEAFDNLGRLVKKQDRNQNKMEFFYDVSGQMSAVMDTMGRMIDFEYYPYEYDNENNRVKAISNRLKTIRDFSGRVLEYRYDEQSGDLISVDFMGWVKKYGYTKNSDIELAHNLEKIIDPLDYASLAWHTHAPSPLSSPLSLVSHCFVFYNYEQNRRSYETSYKINCFDSDVAVCL
jgi:YD repeat-containing protein